MQKRISSSLKLGFSCLLWFASTSNAWALSCPELDGGSAVAGVVVAAGAKGSGSRPQGEPSKGHFESVFGELDPSQLNLEAKLDVLQKFAENSPEEFLIPREASFYKGQSKDGKDTSPLAFLLRILLDTSLRQGRLISSSQAANRAGVGSPKLREGNRDRLVAIALQVLKAPSVRKSEAFFKFLKETVREVTYDQLQGLAPALSATNAYFPFVSRDNKVPLSILSTLFILARYDLIDLYFIISPPNDGVSIVASATGERHVCQSCGTVLARPSSDPNSKSSSNESLDFLNEVVILSALVPRNLQTEIEVFRLLLSKGGLGPQDGHKSQILLHYAISIGSKTLVSVIHSLAPSILRGNLKAVKHYLLATREKVRDFLRVSDRKGSADAKTKAKFEAETMLSLADVMFQHGLREQDTSANIAILGDIISATRFEIPESSKWGENLEKLTDDGGGMYYAPLEPNSLRFLGFFLQHSGLGKEGMMMVPQLVDIAKEAAEAVEIPEVSHYDHIYNPTTVKIRESYLRRQYSLEKVAEVRAKIIAWHKELNNSIDNRLVDLQTLVVIVFLLS